MNAPTRTLYVGLDALDLDIAQGFVAEGALPTLARLLDDDGDRRRRSARSVTSSAVTGSRSYTGTSPSRHQFLCSGQVRGGTYDPVWIGPYGGDGESPSPCGNGCRMRAAGLRCSTRRTRVWAAT